MQSQEGHLSERHRSCFSFSMQLHTGSITAEQQAWEKTDSIASPQNQIPTPGLPLVCSLAMRWIGGLQL